ncbi:MAG: transcriptional regulator [Termitinemataceae bacterium]|nr:MAG: transcriptional regulator [Termitinemataceae bacterium]
MAEKKYKYKIKQRIVYPSQGVGLITTIEEREFHGEKVPYYKVYLEVTDMTIMIPVNRADELGLRPVVPAEDAQKALEFISQDFEQSTADWKMRYQMNMELLKKGTILDIADIVRSLYHRSKVKELPIMERKLYESARKLFEEEIALALKKSRSDVEVIIHNHLENM